MTHAAATPGPPQLAHILARSRPGALRECRYTARFITDQVFIDATDPTIPTILFRGIDGSGDNTAFIDEITLLND